MARARRASKDGAQAGSGAEDAPAAAAAPRKRRSRARVREPVSAPAGFGGLDGTATFGHALADALLSVEGVGALPTWWHLPRLPGLRGTGMQPGIEAACRRHLGIAPSEAVACASGHGDGEVAHLVRFAAAGGETEIPWEGAEGVRASLARCAGTAILLVRGPGAALHVVAPAVVPGVPIPQD